MKRIATELMISFSDSGDTMDKSVYKKVTDSLKRIFNPITLKWIRKSLFFEPLEYENYVSWVSDSQDFWDGGASLGGIRVPLRVEFGTSFFPAFIAEYWKPGVHFSLQNVHDVDAKSLMEWPKVSDCDLFWIDANHYRSLGSVSFDLERDMRSEFQASKSDLGNQIQVLPEFYYEIHGNSDPKMAIWTTIQVLR